MASSSSMRLLGIVGSPRRDGNTQRLVAGALTSAEKAGASVELVFLSDYEIHPCQGCLRCYPKGRRQCTIHDDDMADLVGRMQESDVWILGTPVYCYGPTGQFKIFLDRWISLLPEVVEGTRAAVVVPLHDDAAAGADLTLSILKTMLRGMSIPCIGELVAPGLLHREDLDRHPEYLERAASLGKKLMEPAVNLEGQDGCNA